MFRPCIDLHQGKVKQIVGGALGENDEAPLTNFETDRSSAWFADLYRKDNLSGGHVIMLGPGNEKAALEALSAYPGGFQVGGGITPDNAARWIDAGASHVIVTSYAFRDGELDWKRLDRLIDVVSRQRLVIDLSCRKRDGRYFVVTERWRKFSQVEVNAENLMRLARYADEFLIHAADIEGMRQGVDLDLVTLLSRKSPIPTTYAGGIRNLDDIKEVNLVSRGRLSVTVGSALDIFGGDLAYRDVVEFHHSCAKRG